MGVCVFDVCVYACVRLHVGVCVCGGGGGGVCDVCVYVYVSSHVCVCVFVMYVCV